MLQSNWLSAWAICMVQTRFIFDGICLLLGSVVLHLNTRLAPYPSLPPFGCITLTPYRYVNNIQPFARRMEKMKRYNSRETLNTSFISTNWVSWESAADPNGRIFSQALLISYRKEATIVIESGLDYPNILVLCLQLKHRIFNFWVTVYFRFRLIATPHCFIDYREISNKIIDVPLWPLQYLFVWVNLQILFFFVL